MGDQESSRWFLTAPWEPIFVRRGDALGLRGLDDQLADAVAPGLTNRTRDGRWLTILAWCLEHSHAVWAQAGGGSVSTREAASRRYAWLRPLELMWVARTLVIAADDTRGRQLAGQRRVSAWLREDRATSRFAMTPDQFRGYRQTGMYGAYRTLLRSLPGMTRGRDGWTPDKSCHTLASALDRKLGKARLDSEIDDTRKLQSTWQGQEERWWLRRWPLFDQGADAMLPRKRSEFVALEESELLRALLFGPDPGGTRRSRVAAILSRSQASDHVSLCDELAEALGDEKDAKTIATIPSFTRLADAGMAAMDAISAELAENKDRPGIPLLELVRSKPVRAACAEVASTAKRWLKCERAHVRHIESADRLATAVAQPATESQLVGLLQHHAIAGGGVRWFAIRDRIVEPKLLPGAGVSSRYGFRLWSLARLAVQAAETKRMPGALLSDEGSRSEGDDGDDA